MRRYLPREMIEAYMPLDGPLIQSDQNLLVKKEYTVVLKIGETTFERAQRAMLQKQLEKRFGPLDPAARARLQAWPHDKLEELGVALLSAKSLAELGLAGPA